MNIIYIVYILISINIAVLAIGIVIFAHKHWFSKPNPELTRAKSQSGTIVHEAINDANKVLAQAQIEGLKIVSKEKLHSKALEEKFVNALKDLSIELTKELGVSIQSAQQDYQHFLNTLEGTITKTAANNQTLVKQQTEHFVKQTQEQLSQLVEQTRKQTQQVLEVELADAKRMIEAYRTQRLKIIDDNIAQILDQVLREVLSTSLSTKDHMQIVYKALKKAKSDNILK